MEVRKSGIEVNMMKLVKKAVGKRGGKRKSTKKGDDKAAIGRFIKEEIFGIREGKTDGEEDELSSSGESSSDRSDTKVKEQSVKKIYVGKFKIEI